MPGPQARAQASRGARLTHSLARAAIVLAYDGALPTMERCLRWPGTGGEPFAALGRGSRDRGRTAGPIVGAAARAGPPAATGHHARPRRVHPRLRYHGPPA